MGGIIFKRCLGSEMHDKIVGLYNQAKETSIEALSAADKAELLRSVEWDFGPKSELGPKPELGPKSEPIQVEVQAPRTGFRKKSKSS